MALILDEWVRELAAKVEAIGLRFAAEEMEIRTLVKAPVDEAVRARASESARYVQARVAGHLTELREAWKAAFGDPARDPVEADSAMLNDFERAAGRILAIGQTNIWLWGHAVAVGVAESAEAARELKWEIYHFHMSARKLLRAIGHGRKPENQAWYDAAVRGEAQGPFVRAADVPAWFQERQG